MSNKENLLYPIVGHLSKAGYIFPPDKTIESIYEASKTNSTITEFTIVENGAAIGFMTKITLNELMSGRYGFWLHSKETIQNKMDTIFLKVNYNMPIDRVSNLAMQRSFEQLYNPVVVEKEDKYFGIVTIKDLLDAYTKIEVEVAINTNPLTKLPGNIRIEKEIQNRIFGDKPYCIIYIDLDNFKAYNDAYGFENGDLMLTLTANIIKECTNGEFVGHIGGDDFIVICDYQNGEEFCQAVMDKFSSRVGSLYREDDLKKGFITSINRHGVTDVFPIASLSIAGISNRAKTYENLDDFSNDIAKIKKKCKKHSGNYYEII